MSCISCFDDQEDILLNCKFCKTLICKDCFKVQLNIFKKEIRLPGCSTCKKPYSYSEISKNKIFENMLNDFVEISFNSIINKNEWYFINKNAKINLIEKILVKRMQTLQKMPNCVKYAIEKYMEDDLKKIDKAYSEHITKKIDKAIKKCIKYNCDGFLDNKNKCMLCDIIFCLECENPKQSFHICNEDDLKTIEDIKLNSVNCPKCDVRIHKTEGCNYMTCTVCNYNFLYNNPVLSDNINLTGLGNNHNQVLDIKIIRNVEDVELNIGDKVLKQLLYKISDLKLKKIPDIESFLNCIDIKTLASVESENGIIEIIKTLSPFSTKLKIIKHLDQINDLILYSKTYEQIKKNIISYYEKDNLQEDKLKKYMKILDKAKKTLCK